MLSKQIHNFSKLRQMEISIMRLSREGLPQGNLDASLELSFASAKLDLSHSLWLTSLYPTRRPSRQSSHRLCSISGEGEAMR